jgi:tripartite tricarboxylate transporter TctA family protein
VNLLRIPYQWLVVAILVISIIGVYGVNSSVIDIWIMVVSGGVGYLLRKLGYEMSPLLLALVLGDRLESSFRLALIMSGGSYTTFLDTTSGCGARIRNRAPAADPGARLGVRISQVGHRRSGAGVDKYSIWIRYLSSRQPWGGTIIDRLVDLLLVSRPILTIKGNLKI